MKTDYQPAPVMYRTYHVETYDPHGSRWQRNDLSGVHTLSVARAERQRLVRQCFSAAHVRIVAVTTIEEVVK